MVDRIELTADDVADDWPKVMHWDFPGVNTYDDFLGMVGDDAEAIGMFVQLPAWNPAPEDIKAGVARHYPELTDLFFTWPRE
jgi:hypothetical protein